MRLRTKLFLFVAPCILAFILLGLIALRSFHVIETANDTMEYYHHLHDAMTLLPQLIQQSMDPVEEYLLSSDPAEADRFRDLAAETETGFQLARDLVGEDLDDRAALDQAYAEWQQVWIRADSLMSGPAGAQGEQGVSVVEEMDSLVDTLVAEVEVFYQDHIAQNEAAHEASTRTIHGATWVFVAAVLIVVVGGLISTWLFSSACIRPIVALTRAAESMGRGGFDARAQVKGNDEATLLGRTLNDMAASIQSLLEQQQALIRATQAATIGVGQGEAHRRILDIGLEQLDCDRGAVFVHDLETGALVCSVSAGLSEEFIAAVKQSHPNVPGFGELRDQLPVVVLDALEMPVLVSSTEEVLREGFRSCAILPLILAEDTVGALVICRNAVRAFDDNELRLAQILAVQAANVVDRERMLRTLKQAETEHLTLFDRVPVGLYRANTAGEILQANAAIVQMLGYPNAESVRRHNAIDFYVDAEDRERLMEALESEGAIHDFETQFWRRDGEKIWVRNSAKVVRDRKGEVLYFDGVLEDTTARKNAEQALRRGEERLHSVLQSTRDAIVSVDAQGKVIFWNLGAERAFGYPASEIVGSPLERIIAEPSRRLNSELMESAISNGNGDVLNGPVEIEGLKKSGRSFPVELTLSKWEAEGDTFLTGILRDITSRKQAEEEIRKLSRAIEQSASMVIITDSEGKIEYVNPKFSAVTGYSLEDVEGKNPSFLKSGVTAEEEYDGLRRAVANGQEWRGVFQNRKKNGELFWASASISPVTDEQGRIVHMLAVEEDITERKQAEVHIRQQVDRLGALRAIDMAISASMDPHVTFNLLLQHVVKQLSVDAANILMFNRQTQLLEFASGVGFRTNALRETCLPIGQGHAGRAALERRMVSLPDISADLGEFDRAPLLREEGFVSYYAVPLCAKGQVKGVLEVFHRSPLNPDKEWVNFLEALAAQGAIALDNASLFEDLQRSNVELAHALDAVLEGWAETIELRDATKKGHSRRVVEMAVRLARRIGVRDADLVHVRRGAILHDIGEVGVPEQILLKPDLLNDEETEEMQRHPEYAKQLLSNIEQLTPAIDIPYCHHERWDGGGYPRGLQNDEIPLPARIFAVVDVWDSMRSDRPYRKAWSDAEAMTYLREQSGSHFDPKIVELFLSLLDEMTKST